MSKHVPVLLKEVIEYLKIKPNGTYVDCTLGRGGHSKAILEKLTKNGQLYSIDQDLAAIGEGSKILAKIGGNFQILEGNFANISALLALKNVFSVDGILYDLGVSSPQFDVPERGFSYRFEGPLDMRMDLQNNQLTAQEVVNSKTVAELSLIFQRYGDEQYANTIAQSIVQERPLITTLDLVEAIKKGLPQKVLKQKGHPAKKVFQALRIYVNDELRSLEISLEQGLTLLNPKGRIVVITFHSLEEKVVKAIFKKHTLNEQVRVLEKLPIVPKNSTPAFELVIKKPLKPTTQEIFENKRAHSAKMWVIQKT